MKNLHESLSEFSYGHGVTREVESYLSSVGLHTTPYLPSLRDEGSLGFDVGFNRPGKFLLLQFKLGQELRRFRRSNPRDQIPRLSKPFWRFNVDTSELQFRALREWEDAGAEVYYIAPKFSHWRRFEECYLDGSILENSLTFNPSELDQTQIQSGNRHRIVYDSENHHICSDPLPFEEVNWDDCAKKIAKSIKEGDAKPLSEQLNFLPRIDILFQSFLRLSADSKFSSLPANETMLNILLLEAACIGPVVMLVTDD